MSQLAGELRRKRTDLPTAVLLNIGNRNAVDAVSDGHLDLGMLQSTTLLTSKFYVVDGQHRVLALKKILEEKFDDWASFLIPFVCMLGADEDEEMNQFYIVNPTSKSVRTDLALQGDSVKEGIVRGIDFWAAAPKGAAGSYSGSAGRRVLVAKLKQLLPSVDLE